MKFTVTLKDPDGFHECAMDAAKDAAKAIEGIDEDERESVTETRAEKLRKFMERWVEYGEYVDIEFDTDANTATVVDRRAQP